MINTSFSLFKTQSNNAGEQTQWMERAHSQRGVKLTTTTSELLKNLKIMATKRLGNKKSIKNNFSQHEKFKWMFQCDSSWEARLLRVGEEEAPRIRNKFNLFYFILFFVSNLLTCSPRRLFLPRWSRPRPWPRGPRKAERRLREKSERIFLRLLLRELRCFNSLNNSLVTAMAIGAQVPPPPPGWITQGPRVTPQYLKEKG